MPRAIPINTPATHAISSAFLDGHRAAWTGSHATAGSVGGGGRSGGSESVIAGATGRCGSLDQGKTLER